MTDCPAGSILRIQFAMKLNFQPWCIFSNSVKQAQHLLVELSRGLLAVSKQSRLWWNKSRWGNSVTTPELMECPSHHCNTQETQMLHRFPIIDYFGQDTPSFLGQLCLLFFLINLLLFRTLLCPRANLKASN